MDLKTENRELSRFNALLCNRVSYYRKSSDRRTIIIFLILALWVGRELFAQDKVTVSVYHAVPEQCNEDYLHTAFMFYLGTESHFKHRIIAVSRNLLLRYPKGSKVRLNGTTYDGVYIVMDKMNKRFENRIDILIDKGMQLGF